MPALNLKIEEPTLAARAWDMTKLQMLDTHSELVRYADDFARISSDPSIVEVLERAEEAQLSCHARWFFSQQQRILSPGYKASLQDLLRLRIRTTGVARQTLQKLGRRFEVRDFGGMRAERRKWGTMLPDTDCVFIVASLSEWCQRLGEDGGTNRMSESLSVYETTMKQIKEEASVSTCLFLTNEDELRRQLEQDRVKVLTELATILGEPVEISHDETEGQQAQGGESVHGIPSSSLPTDRLHSLVIDTIRKRFHRVCPPSMCFILNAIDVEASGHSLDAAVMLALTDYARSGRGNGSSAHEVIGRQESRKE